MSFVVTERRRDKGRTEVERQEGTLWMTKAELDMRQRGGGIEFTYT